MKIIIIIFEREAQKISIDLLAGKFLTFICQKKEETIKTEDNFTKTYLLAAIAVFIAVYIY